MTQFLQNPTLRRELAVLLPVLLLATTGAFFCSQICGLFALGLSLFFLIFYLSAMLRRNRQLQQLSQQIDAALYGNDTLLLAACQEGELAILQTALQKLTICLRENAAQMQRDKAFLSDSIADISHQLRTPLTSLNLIAAMLADHGADRQLVQQLKVLLNRIDWLVDTLLKLSKIDAGTIQFRQDPLQARQVLEKAAEPLAVAMDVRQQTLSIDGNADFRADAAWCAEAFGNVLKNCMEHTPTGGQISVQIEQTPIFAQITIRDTGPGFSTQDLAHVFERFYKGSNASPDSFGIGLALAQRIVTGQNGTIQAKNHPEGGALFIIRFYPASA